MKAVILAAGSGGRMGLGLPKALVKVCGLTLLERSALCFQQIGVKDLVVVVGFKADEVREHFEASEVAKGCGSVTWAFNPQFRRGTNLSVLCAREHVGQHFLLAMVDHLFEAPALRPLLDRKEDLVVVVDSRPKFVDTEEATKVLAEKGRLLKLDKKLEVYNCLDAGLFMCSRKIFSAVEEALSQGLEDWNSAKQLFADHHQATTFDLKGAFWLDIDTQEDLKRAEGVMVGGLCPPNPLLGEPGFPQTP